MYPALQLRDFGVAFGPRTVLSGVTFELREREALAILGSGGVGKSTLLRSLAGLNDAQPEHRAWGRALMQGKLIEATHRPAMVTQNCRLLTATVQENLVSALANRERLTRTDQRALLERCLAALDVSSLASSLTEQVVAMPLFAQRIIAIVRGFLQGAPVLGLDEPTAGLEAPEIDAITTLLERVRQDRALIVITHNQRFARAISDHVMLIAGGAIQEHTPSSEFFTSPRTSAGRSFVSWGSCLAEEPSAEAEATSPPEDGSMRSSTQPQPAAIGRSAAPSEFRWLRRGQIAGLPRPGLLSDMNEDLEALKALGVTLLLTLEEEQTLAQGSLRAFGLKGMHFPIRDMMAPDTRSAWSLLADLRALIAAGDVIAVHCRAGLGRTGTILAAFLIFEGSSALAALETVRGINPRWVQSEEQIRFLNALELERFALAGSLM